jgi:hypothetical protein
VNADASGYVRRIQVESGRAVPTMFDREKLGGRRSFGLVSSLVPGLVSLLFRNRSS